LHHGNIIVSSREKFWAIVVVLLEYGVILSEQLLIYLDSTVQKLRAWFIVLLSDVILPDFHKAVGPIVIILIANSLAE
jgi:hypothetical protein